MQQKRFWFSVASVWGVMFATDWIFHNKWLGDLYANTAQFWRPEAEMWSMMWLAFLGNAIFAWAFVWIYTKGLTQDNPWQQAFRYALAILLVSKVPTLLGQWAYSTYPTELLWKWGFVFIVQALACSFAMTWVYKSAWSTQTSKI
jgi:hypothetical protein